MTSSGVLVSDVLNSADVVFMTQWLGHNICVTLWATSQLVEHNKPAKEYLTRGMRLPTIWQV